MRKKVSTYDSLKSTRAGWTVNPVTRIHRDEAKDKKKRRQYEQKLIRDSFK